MFVLYNGRRFPISGNVTPVSEANFYGDPIAANIVMKYAKNASIYPLNVTQGALITPEMANIIDKQGTGQAKLIKPMIDFYYENFYKKNIRVLVEVLYTIYYRLSRL